MVMLITRDLGLSYFDLNRRAAFSLRRHDVKAVPHISLRSRTGLPSISRSKGTKTSAGPASLGPPRKYSAPSGGRPWKPISVADQVVMYLGVFIGVLFSSAVQQFKSGRVTDLNITWGVLAIASVVALAIIPIVFQKLSIRPDAPFLVRFGLFVQSGVFWHVVFGTAGKIISA